MEITAAVFLQAAHYQTMQKIYSFSLVSITRIH